MVAQQRKTIIDALVTQLETDVTDFGLVTDKVLHSATIPTDKYPACIIFEGGDRKRNNVTSSQDFILDVAIRILTKDEDQDDISRDLMEAVVDSINGDLTLGGTCIFADVMDGDPPVQWPAKQGVHIRDMLLFIHYRRDR